MLRSFVNAGITTAALTLLASSAEAQGMELGEALGSLTETVVGEGEDSGQLSGRIIQLIGMMTLLSLAPGILIVMTSFTRFVIVFSILRSALGLNQSPPNMVITSLALFMTFFVMQPVLEDSWNDGLAPLIDGAITEEQALPRITQPFYEFMSVNTRDADLALFYRISQERSNSSNDEAITDDSGAIPAVEFEGLPSDRAEVSWAVLVPAFMISELKRAFTIGFLIYLPFVVIDLIVAAILMGAGMMMLSPVMVSLPFKIIFFVLIDGWYMLAGSLMQSYVSP
jgi:flagellar biosynthesis protein FliP